MDVVSADELTAKREAADRAAFGDLSSEEGDGAFNSEDDEQDDEGSEDDDWDHTDGVTGSGEVQLGGLRNFAAELG